MMNGDEANGFVDLFRARGAEIADACTRCGNCFRACPMTEPGGISDADPSATAAAIVDLITGGGGDDNAARWTEICSVQRQLHPGLQAWHQPAFHGADGARLRPAGARQGAARKSGGAASFGR